MSNERLTAEEALALLAKVATQLNDADDALPEDRCDGDLAGLDSLLGGSAVAIGRAHDALLADRDALVRRVVELEGELRPFAREGDRLRKGPPGAWMNTFVDPGHWYAAAKALAGEQT